MRPQARGLLLFTGALLFFIVAIAVLLASCAQEVKITVPRYALSIGVQDYPNVRHLSYTRSDAISMSQTLAEQGWKSKLILDGQATRALIVSEIGALAAAAEADSTVLIFYSGHGSPSNDGYSSVIAPYDTAMLPGNGSLVDESTVISAPQLADLLAGFATKNIMLVLDCCYSGGFVDPGSGLDASPQNFAQMPSYSALSMAVSNLGSLLASNRSFEGGKAPIVLSAAGSLEESYDGTNGQDNPYGNPSAVETIDMEHGVFTYFLLRAAQYGDGDGDGIVTLTEAYGYTSKKIKDWYLGLPDTVRSNYGFDAFLPHLSGGTRDLALFRR
jgi:uncharacterized caspase-like protein